MKAGLDGLDAAGRRRIDLLASVAMRAADARSWVLGLFNAERELIAFTASGPQIDLRNALTLLCMVPLPQSSDPVALKVEPHGDVTDALGTSVAFGNGTSLAIVFLEPEVTESTRWVAIDAIQSCAAALARELSGLVLERRDAAAPHGPHPHAFFVLTQSLDVKMAWNDDDKASESLVQLVQPSGNRLPVFLERPIRRLISSWNFSSIASCPSMVAFPMRGVCLRVAPMFCGELHVGVFLSSCDEVPRADAMGAEYGISARELQVLHGMLDGSSVAEIADALGLAESTVNDHIARMIGKTNARNRTEMIAILLGWPAMKAKLPTNVALPDDSPGDPDAANSNGRNGWRYRVGAGS